MNMAGCALCRAVCAERNALRDALRDLLSYTAMVELMVYPPEEAQLDDEAVKAARAALGEEP